jgi:hypothetical protein
MNLTVLKAAFEDELQKISVSLAGLSAETILSQKAPEPLETPGVQKALQVLDLAEKQKTAGFKEVAMGGVAGGGLGGFGTNLVANSPWANQWAARRGQAGQTALNNLRWAGTAAGTVLGAGNQIRKEMKAKKQPQPVKTAALDSPGMKLRASRQVGVPTPKLNSGPGIKSQIRGSLIGRKGQIP